MAKRARTVHIFDGWADLPGKGFEVVATNDRWTTLSPDKAEKWDSLPLAKDTKMPVLDMWFDDKEGIVARVHQAGLVAGVFTLPDELPGAHSAADLADCLLILEVLDKKQAKELKKAAMGTPASFAKWTFAHGLEKLLGLPAAKTKKAAAPAKKKAAAKPAKKAAAKPVAKPAKAPAKKKAAAKPNKATKASPRKVR